MLMENVPAQGLKASYLCKTHTESLILQTGLWSLGLILAKGL